MSSRILIGKAGLDGHDRGAKVIARTLRDAGFEVIYSGLHNSPEDIVRAAIQEDVDAIGVSILSGAHEHVFGEILRLLNEADSSIIVFGGGIIPDDDVEVLGKLGVQKIFTPGASSEEIVSWVRAHVPGRS